MSLLIWAVIGVVVSFVLAALVSRKFNHRIVPAVFVVAALVVLGVARWADAQPGADAPMIQAQAFIVGFALLSAVAGSIGWLIFSRQLWAMIASAVASAALLAALPMLLGFLAGIIGIGA